MYYEITISINGKHLFATTERSITNSWELAEVYVILKKKFPKEEGYDITVARWCKTGKIITENEIFGNE